MSRPTQMTLKPKETKAIMKEWKVTKNARKIAEKLGLKRHQVMLFLETERLCSFSEGSYR
jgi:predicted enzyme involved in methoxymalonyl-ACP biosynthesis